MHPRRRLAALTAGFALGGAVYLLLIDTTQLPELYVGAAVALIAAGAFEAAREQGPAEATVTLRMLRRAWRLLLRIPADIARVSLGGAGTPSSRDSRWTAEAGSETDWNAG